MRNVELNIVADPEVGHLKRKYLIGSKIKKLQG
jgi:hypothetical protein